MGLVDDLKGFMKGDVLADDATRVQYSHDASLFEVRPQVVVEPEDVEDIQKIVAYVSERKKKGESISITARSGGTDMTGGSIGESIILEFVKYFNRIKNVSNFSAVVEPGVYYRDFEKETMKQGLLLPSYPASREICALGGMVANNSGGELTPAYGKTARYVYALKAVLSDGNEYIVKPLDKKALKQKIAERSFEGRLYKRMYALIKDHASLIAAARPRVTKNSAGYALWDVWDGEMFDLTKLFVGSQGTLGIITEIKVHLVKPKARTRMVVIFLRNMDQLLSTVNAVREFQPESFESYDDNTLKLAIKFIPDLIKVLKPKNLIKLAWNFLPEARMALTGGFPKLVLLAQFAEDDERVLDETVARVAEKLKGLKANFRVIYDPDEAEKYWVIRRESFNLLRKHVKDKRTAPFIDDFIVGVDAMPEFLPKLNAILAKYPIFYTIAGHVGDGNFHIIPLMNLADPRSKDIIKNLSEEVYSLIIHYKGSITAEHNDGLIRTPYLEKMYGKEVYELFEEVKDMFDPLDIFNPGKKVRGDLRYALNHLVKS